jgi:hypothetical protein
MQVLISLLPLPTSTIEGQNFFLETSYHEELERVEKYTLLQLLFRFEDYIEYLIAPITKQNPV